MLHAWGQGLPGAIQLYNAIQYTAIHRYTLYTLYNTPLRLLGDQHSGIVVLLSRLDSVTFVTYLLT